MTPEDEIVTPENKSNNMKKLILLPCLLVLFRTGVCQEKFIPEDLTKQVYMSRAKKQNTAGWVLLGGGFTFTAAGFIGGSTRFVNELDASFNGEHDSGFRTSSVFFILGITTMLSSIPFFVASSGNRKKEATVFLKMESAPLVLNEIPVKNNFPAVGIKLRL